MYKKDPLQLLNDLLGTKHFEPQMAPLANEKRIIFSKNDNVLF